MSRSLATEALAWLATAGGLWAAEAPPEVAAAVLAAQPVGAALAGWERRRSGEHGLTDVAWGAAVLVVGLVGAAVAAWLSAPNVAVIAVVGALAAHRRAARSDVGSARGSALSDDRISVLLAGLLVLFGALREARSVPAGAALVALAAPWLLGRPSWRTLPVAIAGAVAAAWLPTPNLRPPIGPPVLADLLPPGSDDGRIVARLYGPDVPRSAYLIATALDTFDGHQWTRTTPPPRWMVASAADPRDYVIERGASPDGWLLRFGDTRAIIPLDGSFVRDGGEVRGDGATGAVRYALRATPRWPTAFDAEPATLRHLELPAPLRAMATDVARWRGRPPTTVIAEMVDTLRAEHSYRRDPPPIPGDQPIITFVRERRPGHCELYASALAVWLRLTGTPSRLITGFAGGERKDGVLSFPATAAHVWVEAWVADAWIPVDPTPGIPLDLRLRAPAPTAAAAPMRSAALFLLVVAALSGLAITGRAWWLRRPPRTVAGLHASAETALRKNGWALPPGLPPLATAEWVRARVGDDAAPLVRLAELHYQVKYGDIAADAVLDEARVAWDAARRLRPPMTST